LKYISVDANGNVLGVNTSDQIYYCEGSFNANPKGNSWRKIDDGLACLAVGSHGEVWVVNSAHEIDDILMFLHRFTSFYKREKKETLLN
jgi:hypothetical protein